ncbi:MAG: anti-phage dCTP deaminase [Byssovorax sp.]
MALNSPRSLPLLSSGAESIAASKDDDVGKTILDATSHDLVFAVIGHAGAGATYVAQALIEDMTSKKQDARLIRMSALIAETALKLDPDKWAAVRSSDPLIRTRTLQNAGNALRDTKGSAFTAGLAVRRMHELRSGSDDDKRPIAFVIDSLKNKSEVDAFRKVYGRSFYLISVICGPEVRKKRLRMKYKGTSAEDRDDVASRDEEEKGKTFGQQVRKTIQLGDFFVNNEAETPSSGPDLLAQALTRFLQVVFGTEIVRPTRDERGMYAAWSASLRSSCLSRQVGAAILSPIGQLIATGTNDVPKFGGGLYEESKPGAADHRCFRYPKPAEDEPFGFCRNDKTKETIYEKIIESLREGKALASGFDETKLQRLIEKTPVADLIEFSRAVHAEMDALISLARSGSAASEGGTLYCTTYPCHSCARHIVAAGIRDVIYIEPYTKSQAVALHDDTILETTVEPGDDAKRVHFRLFTGVAPRRFAALFEKREEIKKNGRLRLPLEEDASHQDPVFTKSHVDFEKSIAERVNALETNEGGGL